MAATSPKPAGSVFRVSGRDPDRFMRVWIDPESARRAVGSKGFFSIPVGYRSVALGLAPMFTLVLFSGLAYFAIGLGFAVLSLHELATNGRNRPFNRLIAWSGILLWLPMLLAVVVGALFARRPTQAPVPAAAMQPGSVISERRAVRRAVRQI